MTRFLIAGEISLAEELWNYFVDKYFSVELPYLENFTIQSNALFSVRWIIIGITFGIIIAAISTVYNKRYIGNFVRLLIDRECFDAQSAKTLSELECLRSPGIRQAIKTGGSLSRWVRCAEEDEFYRALEEARAEHEAKNKDEKHPPKFKELQFKRDCDTMHFYVPEEKRFSAEVKFDPKGANWVGVLIVSAIAIALCMFACYILPDALTFADNVISFANGL